MLVYDVTSERSFSDLPNWIDDIKQVNHFTIDNFGLSMISHPI